jgi:hypothetical protein
MLSIWMEKRLKVFRTELIFISQKSCNSLQSVTNIVIQSEEKIALQRKPALIRTTLIR